MEDSEINKVVLGYLHKKGYKQAETAFKDESKLTTSLDQASFDAKCEQESSAVANYILFHGTGDAPSIATYEKSYGDLRKWVENSLDLYKSELDHILYPIFVHCYLDIVSKGASAEAKQFMNKFQADHTKIYQDEIFKLSAVTDPIHLQDNQIACTFRSNKYNLQLSSYSFELFVSFLQENKFNTTLKIVNQYLNIRVVSAKPKHAQNSQHTEEIPRITGLSQRSLSAINEQKIFWGPIPLQPQAEEEIMRIAKGDWNKAPRSSPEYFQAVLHQLKRIKNDSSGPHCPSVDRIPIPMPTATELTADAEKFKNITKRATLALSPQNLLPSIVCYTMHNTYGSVSSMEFSPDSTLMATGSAESYIDLWALSPSTSTFQAMKPSTELATMDLDEIKSMNDIKESVSADRKRLIGHSGPVYATKFSRDNRLLLSASKDGTVRLWSLDLFTNLVAYKGHRFPVWDLDYAPFGYYFVSGSADRTAKIWSTDCAIPLRILSGHLSDVNSCKFHPNSNYVATGSSDGTVRLWDIQNGACVRIFGGGSNGTTCISTLSFSPDGKHLAAGGTDGSICIYDLAASKLLKRLSGHEKAIYSLEFSQEGGVLASGGADCLVKVWDGKFLSSPAGSDSLIGSFLTKQTPISKVHFSHRNILFVGGSFTI